MVRELPNGHRVFQAVISANRSRNVRAIQSIAGDCSWFVPPGQGNNYHNSGATRTFEISHPISEKALIYQRNAALEDAFDADLPCLQMDDDFYRIRHIPEDIDPPCKWNKCPDLPWEDLLVRMTDRLFAAGDVYFSGCTATPNPFFTSKRYTFNRFIQAGFTLTRPNPLRFDPQFPLKEDYDYTCQHLAKYEAILRHEDLLIMFKKTSNVHLYRNDDLEREVVRRLRNKWSPSIIRPNSRNPETEVILKWDEFTYHSYIREQQNGIN